MKIENRQQRLVIAATAAAILLIADRAVLTPLTRVWKDRSATITDLGRQIEQGAALVKREQSIRRRWNQMRSNTLSVNSSLAEQQVLRAFEAWSRESRAAITSITPQWKHDSDDYVTLECRVDAAGNIETLSRFLYNIEKDPMALQLTSVELSAHDDNGQQMTVGLQVSGLVLTPATP